MSLKNNWIPQDETMDASPDIPNMLADAIIQNETDIQRLKDDFEDLDIGGAGKSPYIGENGNWYEWDSDGEAFVDTGVKAEGYTPQKGIDYWTEEDKAEIIEEVAPFTVNVEVEFSTLDGSFIGISGDKTYDDICEAATNGMAVIAHVYKTGHVSLMEGEPIDMLWLVKYDDKALNTGKAIFSSIKNNGENACESTILTLEKRYGVETWEIETTTLSSKEYIDAALETVDNQIGNIETALDGIIAIQEQLMGVSE